MVNNVGSKNICRWLIKKHEIANSGHIICRKQIRIMVQVALILRWSDIALYIKKISYNNIMLYLWTVKFPRLLSYTPCSHQGRLTATVIELASGSR